MRDCLKSFFKEVVMGKRLLSILFFLFLFSFTLSAQQKYTYSGKVIDEKGNPLPGVSVIAKGVSNLGTITDVDGKFMLETNKSSLTLTFSMVGYKTVEQTFSPSANIVVTMQQEQVSLESVVVLGYATQKKSLVTGAISSVKGNEISSLPVSRADYALQSLSSGVLVLPTSGSPGAGTQIRIRGINSNGYANPLFIVDGMKTGDISDLDPNDIASIEVLKDAASAAIYGTEGSNGVVLITTKSGKAGKSTVSYDMQYAVQVPRIHTRLMNAQEYLQWMKEAGDTLADTGYDTDWLHELMQNAPMQRHHVSFSGGSANTNYLFSASYFDQDGIVGGDKANYNRQTAHFNIKTKVKKWLEIGLRANYEHSNHRYIAEDNEYRSVVNSALLMDPLTPVVYENGLPADKQSLLDQGYKLLQDAQGHYYALASYATGEIVNPIAYLQTFHNKIKQDKILSTAYINIMPFEGFKFTSRFGYELTYQLNHAWTPEYYFSIESNNTMTNVSDNINKWYGWLWENFMTYHKTIGGSDFSLLLGTSAEDRRSNWFYLYSAPMIMEGDQYAYHSFTTSQAFDRVGSTFSRRTMLSFYGRIMYSYKEKYLFEASLRRDAASVFPPKHRAGYFPAVSLGWVVSREDFFNVPFISYLKIRASWGQNGSMANLPGNEDREFWTLAGIEYPNALDQFVSGARIDRLANTDLKWERTDMKDLGIDLGMFDQRLTFSFDLYNKLTKNLIVPGSGPLSVGNNFPNVNGGDVSNKGFDIDLGYRDNIGDFHYSVNLNFSHFTNKVVRLAVNTPVAGANVRGYNLTWFEQGYPIWYFKGYDVIGIDPDTGDPIVNDVDGDGQITSADQTYIGDPYPDFLYGGSLNLSYKNFGFNVIMQGSKGNDIFMGWFRSDRPRTNKPEFFYNDRWTPDHTDASMPRANNVSDFIYRSSLMVRDGSYLRIRQIQFSYTLPSKWFAGHLQSARVYISMDDYFTFTKYPGLDPAIGSTNITSQGVDKGVYPLAGKIMTGFSVKF